MPWIKPDPEKLKQFFDEIEAVCKKHNISIGHEDGHGAFELHPFDENNMDQLRRAHDHLTHWVKEEEGS